VIILLRYTLWIVLGYKLSMHYGHKQKRENGIARYLQIMGK
jgi:hypothetical protein